MNNKDACMILCGVTDSSLFSFQQSAPFYMVAVLKQLHINHGFSTGGRQTACSPLKSFYTAQIYFNILPHCMITNS
jgi:hypothetical protein